MRSGRSIPNVARSLGVWLTMAGERLSGACERRLDAADA
jgi:hypothetical protein